MFSNAKGRAPRTQTLNKSKACKTMQPWLFVGCWEAGVSFHLACGVSHSFFAYEQFTKAKWLADESFVHLDFLWLEQIGCTACLS